MAKPHASRLVAVLLAAAAGFVTGVAGTELTFGQLRPEPQASLLYSVEVRDEAGALLASPLLVGREGDGLHLQLHQSLAQPGAEPEEGAFLPLPALQMSLDLDPQPAGLRSGPAPQLCLGYKLSIDDGKAHQGTLHQGRISLPFGEPRSLQLGEGGETLRLQLTVARAGSKEFEQILRAHRRARPLT
jgi:hypothetical protein